MQETLADLIFDSPTDDALATDAAFWHLYESSFPSKEREPRKVILESIRQRVAFVIRGRVRSRAVGLATAHVLREPPILFIVYLAVAPEFRSRRIGAALFERLCVTGVERYAESGIEPAGEVWEVEPPETASCEEDFQQRQRRIAFFARLGAHVLPHRYFQPPLDGGASVQMHLMFRPAGAGDRCCVMLRFPQSFALYILRNIIV